MDKVCVFQDWLFDLTMQMQSVLVMATRGPDTIAKFHPAKLIVARYRASVLKAAYLGRAMWPGEGDATTFMTLEGFDAASPGTWNTITQAWFDMIDEIPHHYIMHLMHGAQIIGYKHPEILYKNRWQGFYIRSCQDLHLTPETEDQMDNRLCDWDRKHWDGKGEPDLRTQLTNLNKEIDRLDRRRDIVSMALAEQNPENTYEDRPEPSMPLR
jgi:hypothetical protein